MSDLSIDFVSPLPPVRSGIADYGADLLPHLAERCDLRLVRLPELPIDADLATRFPVVGPDRLGEAGRLPWYQMGNNRYHLAIYDLALDRPGVVTLHDLVLHHFQVERTLRRDDFETYRRQLADDHGWIGDAAALPRRWPGGAGTAAQFALPAHRSLLRRQRGVLTHSAWAADLLREEIEGLRVVAVPMGVPLGPLPDPVAGGAFRRRHGVPEGAPLLGSFGFQTPMKRTARVIEALAAAELKGVHLLVGGETAEASGLEAAARRFAVADRVHFLGFLPFDELQAAIAAADLCLNLRYPTAGETSASLLRILAVGKPAVISDHAQSADLDGGVVKVPVGEGEVAALVGRLAALLADRDELERLSAEARETVRRRHDPAAAAAAMVDACRLLRDAELIDLGPARPPRPTSLTARRFAGELDVAGADDWPAGTRRRLRVRLVNRGDARWLAGERPDGGVALDIRLLSGGQNLLAGRPWPALPRDLDPGDAHVFELEIRCPVAGGRLRIEPHAFHRGGFAELGGPVWERDIGTAPV